MKITLTGTFKKYDGRVEGLCGSGWKIQVALFDKEMNLLVPLNAGNLSVTS
jgi:hypothetical protein